MWIASSWTTPRPWPGCARRWACRLLSLWGACPLYEGSVPLLRARGVERDVERASSRSVALPSGGTLVIDEAEALTAIDVNTARSTGRGRKGTGPGLVAGRDGA